MADLYNPNNDRCLCNTHVESGARAIAIVFLVLEGISVFYLIANMAAAGVTGFTILQLLWTVLAICFLVLVLKAQNKRNPTLYVPYLVVMGLEVAFSIVLVFFVVFCTFFSQEAFIEYMRDEGHIDLNDEKYRKMLPALMISMTVGALIGLAIHLYLFSVMWRAYKYLKREVNRSNIAYTYNA